MRVLTKVLTHIQCLNPQEKLLGMNVKISRKWILYRTKFCLVEQDWAQIYRHQTLEDPWKNQGDGTIITDNPEQYGDGTDVDIIVNDTASWLGHIEFVVVLVNPQILLEQTKKWICRLLLQQEYVVCWM